MNSFIFLGGDMRSVYAAKRLGERYDCLVYGVGCPDLPSGVNRTEKIIPCGCAVLPLPASMDGKTICAPYSDESMDFSILEKAVKKGGTVFTSKSFPLLEQTCAESGLELVNYFEREELAVLNAVPTAEGALEIVLRELPFTVFGSRVLVTGFGRVAKALVKCFVPLGAKVSVACRRYSDMAWAEICGCKPVSLLNAGELERELPETDIILNTVPARIFDRKRVSLMRRGTLILELASEASVENEELAKRTGVRVIWARSLPGKTAPVTAGGIIADTLANILTERSINNGA